MPWLRVTYHNTQKRIFLDHANNCHAAGIKPTPYASQSKLANEVVSYQELPRIGTSEAYVCLSNPNSVESTHRMWISSHQSIPPSIIWPRYLLLSIWMSTTYCSGGGISHCINKSSFSWLIYSNSRIVCLSVRRIPRAFFRDKRYINDVFCPYLLKCDKLAKRKVVAFLQYCHEWLRRL